MQDGSTGFKTATSSLSDAGGHVRPPTVLVVDDDEAVRMLFGRWLAFQGYTVIAVANGAAALEAVRTQRPDVVLLDIAMPGLNGVEVCQRIKREEASRLTPVILVSAVDGVEDRIAGLAAGADDFLSKPPDVNELLTRVGAVVRVNAHQREASAPADLLLFSDHNPQTRQARHAPRLGLKP